MRTQTIQFYPGLIRFERELRSTGFNPVCSVDTPLDELTLKQLEEDIGDVKSDLRSTTHDSTMLDLADDNELIKLERELRDKRSKASLKVKCLASDKSATGGEPGSNSTGVKLSNIDVPRFDDCILS